MQSPLRQQRQALPLLLLLLRLAGHTSGLKLRILGETARSGGNDGTDGPYEHRKIGDGPGRPLYQINTIEYQVNQTAKQCLVLRMDKYTHSFSIDHGEYDGNSVAWGCYNESLNSTGWSTLQITTTDDKDTPLGVRAYGAGLLEGFLTAHRIGEFHRNVDSLLKKDTTTGVGQAAVDRILRLALLAWENFAGGDAAIEPQDDLPRQAWALMLQMRGIRDGCNLQSGEEEGVEMMSAFQIMMVNMHAEIPAIVDLYARSEQAKAMSLLETGSQSSRRYSRNGTEWARWGAHAPHGSAIVKRVGALNAPTDLITGHVTHGEYGEMTRIIKTYNLHFETAVSHVTMSSYPGCVSSTDDYFVTGQGFVLMSTSLFLPSEGPDAEPATTNEGLPAFLRAIMATRIARQPRMWARIYGYIKGIAGAKQWVIADYSQFKELQPIANDTVWLVESLPRTQRANDVSHIVRSSGFFEAHGVPHFRDVRLIYGLPEQGPGPYEELRQVALIDKGATISSLDNIREVLRESKPSRNNQIPISGRNDLDPTAPIPSGGIDAKTTNKCLVKQVGMQAVSGPPAYPMIGGKTFEWETKRRPNFPGWPHDGLPNSWNFDWVNVVTGPSTLELQAPIVPQMTTCTPGET